MKDTLSSFAYWCIDWTVLGSSIASIPKTELIQTESNTPASSMVSLTVVCITLVLFIED